MRVGAQTSKDVQLPFCYLHSISNDKLKIWSRSPLLQALLRIQIGKRGFTLKEEALDASSVSPSFVSCNDLEVRRDYASLRILVVLYSFTCPQVIVLFLLLLACSKFVKSIILFYSRGYYYTWMWILHTALEVRNKSLFKHF